MGIRNFSTFNKKLNLKLFIDGVSVPEFAEFNDKGRSGFNLVCGQNPLYTALS
jgi:hypothetical protein